VDPPARRIVRLSSSTEDDVASFPEVVSAKKVLENQKGLLRLAQGLAVRWGCWDGSHIFFTVVAVVFNASPISSC